MTQRYELMAWLGPAAEELTEEQIQQVAEASDEIDARYHADLQDQRDAALSAVVQFLLGETTPEDANRELIAARNAADRAYAAALQVAVMAHRSGTPKATAAREAGVDRMSLLKALGER